MVDQLLGTLVYFAAAIGGGFLSSWMAFNASGEVFSGRKHGNALITGALTGLSYAITAVAIDIFTGLSDAAFAVLVFSAFWTAFGIDRARSDGSDMVARNAVDNGLKPTEEPTS